MKQTPYLGLNVTTDADDTMRFIDWRHSIAGDAPDSNFNIIDGAFQDVYNHMLYTDYQGVFDFFGSVSQVSSQAAVLGNTAIAYLGTQNAVTNVQRGDYNGTSWAFTNVVPLPQSGMWLFAKKILGMTDTPFGMAVYKNDGVNPVSFDTVAYPVSYGPGGSYYINPDPNIGNDANNGLTAATAFRTIKHAYDQLPSLVTGFVTFSLADGDYTKNEGYLISFLNSKVIAKGFTIAGNSSNNAKVVIPQLAFYNVRCQSLNLRYLTINNTAGMAAIDIENSYSYAIIDSCIINGSNTVNSVGISLNGGGALNASNNTLNNCMTAISAQYGIIISTNNSGTGNTTALSASNRGTIVKNSNQPQGQETWLTGGIITSDEQWSVLKNLADGMTPNQYTPLPPDSTWALGNGKTILNWYAVMLKEITGQADWFTPPFRSLSQIIGPGITYYVNVATGNDGNDGLTTGTAFKTIDHAMQLLPAVTIGTVTINLADGDYRSEGVLGYKGLSFTEGLTIQGSSGDATKVTLAGLNFIGLKSANLRLLNITFSNDNDPMLQFDTCQSLVRVYCCNFNGASANTMCYGIFAKNTNYVEPTNCAFNNCYVALRSTGGSNLLSTGNSGSGNYVVLDAEAMGVIAKVGTQPTGTAQEFKATGGVIISTSQTIYSSLQELGLTNAATLDQIIAAMPDMSVLYLNANGNLDSSVTPYPSLPIDQAQGTYGLITITRFSGLRTTLTYVSHTTPIISYFGNYNTGVSPKFSGWKQYAVKDATQTWNDPVYSNGYVASLGGTTLKYTKDGLGNVTISGKFMKSSALVSSEVIFTLPAGYRPDAWGTYAVAIIVPTSAAILMAINNTGTVTWSGVTLPAYVPTQEVAVNVTFKAMN